MDGDWKMGMFNVFLGISPTIMRICGMNKVGGKKEKP